MIDFQVWHDQRLVEDNRGDKAYLLKAFSDYLESLETDKPGDGFTFMVFQS